MPASKLDEDVKAFEKEHEEVLRSVNPVRILWPILIGLSVVGFLVYRQVDADSLQSLSWNSRSILWVFLAILLLVIRHLAYSFRIWSISGGEFSFRKCVELIFIWEFSSSVTPTSVGGSAVALFVMSQEKLSTARTAAIVIYTVVLDSFFFLITVPILFAIFGFTMLKPGATSWHELDYLAQYCITNYGLMLIYASLFYYGLFKDPRRIGQFLIWCTKWPLLSRFRANAEKIAHEFIEASEEMTKKERAFHLRAIAATVTAWVCKFALMGSLVVAFTAILPTNFYDQLLLFARFESMFLIIKLAPSPGGAGFAEWLFGHFVHDYVSGAMVIALFWRLLAYYSYLIIGSIVVPNWIRSKVAQRREEKLARQ